MQDWDLKVEHLTLSTFQYSSNAITLLTILIRQCFIVSTCFKNALNAFNFLAFLGCGNVDWG